MAIKFKYCRIQGRELAANTKTGKGIFSILNQMVTNGTMDEEDVGLFREIDYEDDYQVVVKVDENVVIEDVQKGWGPAVDPA